MDCFLTSAGGPDSLSLQEMLDMDIKTEKDIDDIFGIDNSLNFQELPAINLDEDSLGKSLTRFYHNPGLSTRLITSEMQFFFNNHIYIYSPIYSVRGLERMNWADLMAAHGAFGTDFYVRSILRPKHIKIGPKGALGSHAIRPIHSAPSLGQSIVLFKN